MKLSELISAYGDENVVFQNLDECFNAADATQKGVKVSFITKELKMSDLVTGHLSKLALIVWLDRAKVAEIIKRTTP